MISKRRLSRLALVLKITLLNTRPAIWRRFVVPAGISLDRLHDVIQIVMGWDDTHLHLFNINGAAYSEQPEEDFEGQEENQFRLGELLTSADIPIEYRYDFGDGWRHSLKLEEIVDAPDDYDPVAYKCLAGKRRCPPEDVGGTYRFPEFLKALRNPKHPQHKHYLTWVGPAFDPAEFNPAAINELLRKYERWSRPRRI